MHFIKLGERYINLDAVAAIVPNEKGLGYAVSFIGNKGSMNICEMDAGDIKRALEMATIEKAAIDETNLIVNSSSEDMLDWVKRNLKETKK